MGYEDNVRRVTPYVPGEQPGGNVIKLNTNESPYPPSPMVTEALKGMNCGLLRKYPDINSEPLISAIAEYYGVERNQVFAGVGSDDILSLCFLTYFGGKKPVLFPDITYSFYDVWAEVYGIPYERVPLRKDFSLDPSLYVGRENGGIVIANPNAPTGLAADLSVIEEIVRSNPDVFVIVDEAYIDFGGETALPLLKDYDNLLIVRTMSKSRSLAGMRLGYAMGRKEAIRFLSDVKFSVNSYTLNTPALLAGAAAMKDRAYFEETRDRIIKTREWTKKELKALGFDLPDSSANFVFASHEGVRENETRAGIAKRIFTSLKEKDIYVRYFDKPVLNEYLRISIGTDEEMELLTGELKKILN